MNKILGLKALLLTSPLILTTAFAEEQQPLAEDLVGKFYGGAHLLRINTDGDRVPTPPLEASDPYATSSHGSGFGAEVGYRFTESVEFRFSADKINLDKKNSTFDNPYAGSLDALYFPNKQNFYLLGGLGNLDIGQNQQSLDVGAGYRYYLDESTAVYFEGKGHYQFANHYKDASLRLGLVFFFESPKKSAPVRKKEEPKTLAAALLVSNDSDNDGVLNKDDLCANTPERDKVDSNGCTLFSASTDRVNLLVNFDNNKSFVNAKYIPEIQKMAEFLNKYKDLSLVIEGHTSKVGKAAYNKKLSQKRADAIVSLLVNKFNIDSKRLTAIGYGEERLLDTANTKEAHHVNRRIEVKVSETISVPKK